MRIRSLFASALLGVFLGLLVLGPAPALAGTVLDNARIKVSVDAKFLNDLDPVDAEFNASLNYILALTDGNAANKAELVYLKTDSVTASGTDSWDLAGSLTDAFGNTITCTKLKGVIVWNKSSTAGDILNVIRPATDGAAIFGADGDLSAIGPGGLFAWIVPSAAAVTVTGGDTDNIDITETGGANTVSYQIMFICTDS